MNKVHVFNAGPCLLPQVVLDNAKAAIDNFAGTGVSLLCISHRTKEWEAVMDETRALWKELLHIPEDYEVVFLAGGASMEFLYVAMNFLEKKADVVKVSDVQGEPGPFDMTLTLADGSEKIISVAELETNQTNAILTELESFHDAIINDTEPPVTIEDGVEVLKVAYLILDEINKHQSLLEKHLK